MFCGLHPKEKCPRNFLLADSAHIETLAALLRMQCLVESHVRRNCESRECRWGPVGCDELFKM